MSSLRRRLFLILMAATGLIWLCAVAWISIGSRSELEHVLDTRLQEAARMVHSLVMAGEHAPGGAAPALADTLPSTPLGYERQLSCQIWSFDGRLLARSSGAPDAALADESEGFSDHEVDGETWRVYTIVDPEKDVRVVVGDRIGLRDRLVRDLVAGLAAPALLAMPLLGLLIWWSLGRGLQPLNRAAKEIAAREGEDMRPVPPDGTPSEIQPLIGALNGLFAKVEAARAHERDVTAFAAHELRTPLAGLKTQAQVALATPDAATRENALRQIIVSVDRTARLVRQLLALARLDAGAAGAARETSIGALLREIVAAVPRPPGIRVTVDPALDAIVRPLDSDTLALVLRNLHENAVQHMVAGSIRWSVEDGARLVIEDEGPGIPGDELDLVRQRFYRGRTMAGPGSGLGLAIAETAAARLGARLDLANRADRTGLRAVVDLRHR
ncbi:sensor histidine kinase N-terminal domain-containing protein [Ancylobacter dichloromethanicus]|uniref:histidine kinase n=1 Tax=Ancylobacter dichloromethanicus TaxID=518825 RepID=A0A9W6J9H9_9HYPH|nr:ATP-binding protein [Ancylobacter dichloromethanicus]MBS7552825.1 sensor histidine kinase N-terminal domain-containing protein [Ancylobacter dichloromethanicus]GLK73187.1 two-component sensor histidine kinase [Ancylobacter dichloromethanicus]